ncbi:MAG: DivIVA domain-containing protein [Anaerovoracaceae bacterium]|nr:DivIVA domain-containing protein [Anaerovoracaceae bacterium]
MITPVDIEQKEFTRGVRGYKEEEVDTFLNLIILEMENLIRTNRELSDENSKLKEELATSRNTESEVLETLETAKRLMSEISASAEKRAEVLLKNAELDADLIRREARETSERFMDESKSIRTRVSALREKYKNLLEAELERFDMLSADIFTEADDIVKSLPEEKETIRAGRAADTADKTDKVDISKTMINIR